jgi:hypothetical protein
VSRRLYELAGLAVGFILVDYGFNFIAMGFPGARETTSQFLGANFLIAGSALIFIGLYYLLKPSAPTLTESGPTTGAPDIGVELIVEDTPGPQVSFYRKIEYIGYLFTVLGLISAADLVLQVLISSHYDEARWWVEVLLVVFGVLSYTILGSAGRIGSQEEAKLPPEKIVTPTALAATPSQPQTSPSYPATLEVNLDQFTKTSSGEFEHRLTGNTYDMLRVESELVTIWREDRQGIRSAYLAGPYEMKRSTFEEQIAHNQDLTIGSLTINAATASRLLELQKQATH